MDVSFIIPARNEQRTLRHTVANLHTTVTGCSFEVIVVDDDSDDDLSRHLEPSPTIVYLRNRERLGVAKSRNIGARAARGDLLVFLDAHVCFTPGWLAAVFREETLLARGPVTTATFVIRSFANFLTLATELRVPWPVRLRNLGGGYEYYGYVMTPLPTPQTRANFAKRSREPFEIPVAGGASLCIAKNLFFDLGAFEDELSGFGSHEDAELCMRCWAFGYRVSVIPSIRCFHFAPRREYALDYESRPFHAAHDAHGVENALRLFYLHLPDDDFHRLIDVYKDHPGFKPDLAAVLTDRLRRRKDCIASRRIHDHHWLLDRMTRV